MSNDPVFPVSLFLPADPEMFTYDDDGNLKDDGRWTYTWDGENRLIRMETKVGLGSLLPRQRLDFVYDYQGRRAGKEVWEWDDSQSTWVSTDARHFHYHGWNLVAEVDDAGTVLKSYLWGLDVSGSLTKAGGVGGLVAIQDHATSDVFYPAFDGNGNVTGLFDSADASVAAVYEYGPFGEEIRASGLAAEVNPFRFSTKYQDADGELYYYGYRYYNAGMGRWLNRDPIGEEGGLNLYAFVNNGPGNYWDYLGESPFPNTQGTTSGDSEDDHPYYGYHPGYPGGKHEWPEPPFPEGSGTSVEAGWYRHCVANCKLMRKRPGNPFWMFIVNFGAQFWGGDLPGLKSRRQGDVEANYWGQDLACLEGSCEDLCTEAHPGNPFWDTFTLSGL